MLGIFGSMRSLGCSPGAGVLNGFSSFYLEKNMRIPSSVFAAKRYALVLTLIAGSVVLLNGQRKAAFTVHDKAYYAPQAIVQYVNPGLVFSVVSAKIASDGTISVDYKVTDPKGLPLDTAGIQTPGTISPRFLVAYIPKGQSQFASYIVNTVTAVKGGATGTQAAGDSGGTTQTVAVGEYIYTYKNKAPAGFDQAATHRVGVYGSRNLTQWDLGTNYASTTFDWVPAGNGAKPAPRDVVRTADCNQCHDDLAFHGGSRRGVELCIMCHQPQTVDPNTGNSLDMKVFIHSIHQGSALPSVKAGTPYQIYGHGGYSDFSSIVYPSYSASVADARNCQSCHNPKNGAAQTNAWVTNPNRMACGGCHNDVNFATGQNHVNLPQVDDNQCNQCHIPKGELEFDASIMGAHVTPSHSSTAPGLNLRITKIVGGAGQKPVVTFTMKDDSGAPISLAQMTGGSNRLAIVMAGPTTDYGYTNFGAELNTPGYVSENALTSATCGGDGTCQYTFTHAVPAGATGTFAIGMEGRRSLTLLPGTTKQTTTNVGAKNPVSYFSVDGSPVVPRRTVVATDNCNRCHTSLSLHGENRNQVEMCVLCHNPSEGDESVRPAATTASDKTKPTQGVNFAMMIHKIHTGEKMAEGGQTYTIVGFGGSHNEFSDVRYPSMTNGGSTGNTAACYMCHVNNSESNFPIGLNNVTDPQGLMNPAPATTSACTACHFDKPVFAHANSQIDPKFGESCSVCHGAGAAYDVLKVHAGQ
jgi:OmcA/MtrC family decaheme c-type cytochrome